MVLGSIRIHGQVSIGILTTRNGEILFPWLHYDARHEDGPAIQTLPEIQ